MLSYIGLLLISLFCAWFYYVKGQKTGKHFCYLLLWAYAILLSGLSYRIGADIYNYSNSYDNVPSFPELSWSDLSNSLYPLFLLFCALCRSISQEFYVLHLFQSTIVCSVIFFFIYRRTQYRFIGVCIFITLFYSYFCFEILKESLAVAMLLLGYDYLDRRKKGKYFLFVVIAILFHPSAFVALILPFIRKIGFDKSFIFGLVCIGGFIIALSSISEYLSVAENIYNRVQAYTEEYRSVKFYIIQIISSVIIPFFLLVIFKGRDKNFPFEWAFCAYVLCGIGILPYKVIFLRFLNYLLPFLVIPLSDAFGNLRKSSPSFRFFLLGCYTAFTLSRNLVYWYKDGWKIYYPYSSIFTKMIDIQRENWMYDFWGY